MFENGEFTEARRGRTAATAMFIKDANWNVVALTDAGGGLVERYAYTPYGELTVVVFVKLRTF